MARAVDILVRDAGQPVDYAYISVRNLGSIYEGLLENRLRSALDCRRWAAVRVLVNDKGERKATGSYYTPDYIVDYIVEQTLDADPGRAQAGASPRPWTASPGCASKLAGTDGRGHGSRCCASNWSGPSAGRARPSWASRSATRPWARGHFLVNAVDFITDGIIQRMQAYHDEHPDVPWAWNPIQRLIERVRGDILAEMAQPGHRRRPGRGWTTPRC